MNVSEPKQTKKRLLIYAHYYVPDVASTGQILRELAEGLLDTFDVTVICVVPSYEGTIAPEYQKKRFYREEIGGVQVLRIRVPAFSKADKGSRIRNILGYFFGAMRATFMVGKQDYVFSISQPPILGGLLGVWGKWMKRARFIYNIQDFNPEQVMAVGYSKSGLVLKAMMALDKFSCRRSSLVITVGRDLVDTMHRRFRGKRVPKTALINNWIDESAVRPLRLDDAGVAEFRRQYGLEGKFVVMYSGNIGLYYDLENLMNVMAEVKPGTRTPAGREVAFAFVGAGSVLDSLKAIAAEKKMDNVVFIPYQDKDKLPSSLNAADVHWCVNARGIKGVSCPSKFYGIAAAAKPVLAVLEEGSEVRMLIDETRCGLSAEPGDYAAIAQNLHAIIAMDGTAELAEMGSRGCEYLQRHLTRAVSIDKYRKAILES